MDSKEIKGLLKQAREAIKEKDYKAVLKYCKNILKEDKANYNAWVFVGVAAQETDQPEQSEAAFKKAIEIYPEQLLAWQGLCSFYENHETAAIIPQLLSTYKRLLELFSDDKEKKLEIYDKLIAVLKRNKDREKLLKVLQSKFEEVKGKEDQELQIHKEIFELFSGKSKLSENEKQAQSDAFSALLAKESETDCSRVLTNCIEDLFKAGEEEQAYRLARLVHHKFPLNKMCVGWMQRFTMAQFIDEGTLTDEFEGLSDSTSSEALADIFKGFCRFVAHKYLDALSLIQKGLAALEYCVVGWYYLSKSQLCLHLYRDAEKSAKTGLDLLLKSSSPSSATIGKFYLLLGEASSGYENWELSLKVLQKCVSYLGQSKELLIVFCSTLLEIGQTDKAEKMCDELESKFGDDPQVLQLKGFLLISKKEFEAALNVLRRAHAQSAYTLHLIGLVLWETNRREKALEIFKKAVELDPYYSKNYLYLGHYYYYCGDDKKKSCLCYRKAFELNSWDMEIGMSYSRALKACGGEKENMAVLKTITENSDAGSAKWAWIQLGLYQLQNNLINEAIYSLRSALRTDPSNSSMWECLADAYLKRGSYENALRVFEKVSEMNPEALYPLYQIATIQKVRGFYTEAIEKFQHLLTIVPTYVPGLIGLSETLLLSAGRALADCLYGCTKDLCQQALLVLAKVVPLKSNLVSLWKLAGDACLLPAKLDDKWFPFTIPDQLHNQTQCDKLQLLTVSSKFFGQALHLQADASSLWHDLGVSYFCHARLSSDQEGAQKAFLCLQKAVCLSPLSQEHWTTLGVIALSPELNDCAFGQHALIKSLEINKTHARTWTNLGVLYLEKENISMSHMALKMAQAAEPTYPISWIGQAVIADRVRHAETLDLFRHATSLCSHNEALVGYARLVCETLLQTTQKDSVAYQYNIQQLDAVVCGGDCAVKFTANNAKSAEAFNMLGLLLERQGIYNAALNAFKRSLELLVSDGRSDCVELVRANYARLLSTVGEVDKSVREFLSLKKVDSGVICSFALAFYRDNQLEQAFKLFGKAFEKSKVPADQSHIKVAMSIVASKMTGPDAPNPMACLAESAQITPASVPGLLALYSQGILRSQPKLIQVARTKLQRSKFHKDYAAQTQILWSAEAYITNGVRSGRNELLKFIHSAPHLPELWLQAACRLLQWDSRLVQAASACADAGSAHGGCREQAAQVAALCHLARGDRKRALVAAQKALLIGPGKLSNWATLVAACHVANVDRKRVGWMYRRTFGAEESLSLVGWFVVMEVFHALHSGHLENAASKITQALNGTFSPQVQSCLHVLESVVQVLSSPGGDLTPLFLVLKNNPNSFFAWNVLIGFLITSDKFEEGVKTISHFLTTSEKVFPKWRVYALLQLSLLSFKALQKNPGSKEKWLQVGEEACGKAVHLAPTNHAARFMQGLFALESGNSNLARRSFEKVVSGESAEAWLVQRAQHLLQANNLTRHQN